MKKLPWFLSDAGIAFQIGIIWLPALVFLIAMGGWAEASISTMAGVGLAAYLDDRFRSQS